MRMIDALIIAIGLTLLFLSIPYVGGDNWQWVFISFGVGIVSYFVVLGILSLFS